MDPEFRTEIPEINTTGISGLGLFPEILSFYLYHVSRFRADSKLAFLWFLIIVKINSEFIFTFPKMQILDLMKI